MSTPIMEQLKSTNIASQLEYDIANHLKKVLVHLDFYLMMSETCENSYDTKLCGSTADIK